MAHARILKDNSCAAEDELLREALKQAKPILCTRLPIDFLPTVLESKKVISSVEYQYIRAERSSVDMSMKLMEKMEKKSIPTIRRFLEILKSDEYFCGYRYLAEMVESDCAALAKKKLVFTDVSHSSAKQTLTGGPPSSSTPLSQSLEDHPQVCVLDGTHDDTSMPPVPCDTQVAAAALNESGEYIEEPLSGTHGGTIMSVAPMRCKLQVISCILFKDKVYVTGIAKDEDVGSHQVQVYSLNEREWFALPVAPNYNAPAAIINGRFTLIGGRFSGNTAITSTLCTWIEEKRMWVQTVTNMPTVRLESGVCYHDNLLLVAGGIVEAKENMSGKLVNTVDVYNFSTKCWSTPKALELPKVLQSHHLVVFEGNIYLTGGAVVYPALPEGPDTQFNDEAWRAQWSDVKVAVTQPSKQKSVWTPIKAPPDLRPTVVSYRNSLFSVGGVKEGKPKKAIYKFVDGEIVDGKVDTCWKPVGYIREGKYRHGVAPLGTHGDALFVAGGRIQGNPLEDKIHEKSSSVDLVLL